jgi:dynactin-5
VEAASIGSFVSIGKNCVIGRFVIIKDCVRIEDNTVIAPHTVVSSFSVYGGSPGVWKDDLPESTQEMYEAQSKDQYAKFIARE